MSVRRCLSEVTYSEYKSWEWYFKNDHLDVIDRSDIYAMQIAQTVARVLAGKDAKKIKVEHYFCRGSHVYKTLTGVLVETRLIPLRLMSNEGKSEHQKDIERATFKLVWGARIKAGTTGERPPRKSTG